MRVLLLLLVVLVSGCTQSMAPAPVASHPVASPHAGADASVPFPMPGIEPWTFHDCLQFHTLFPAQANSFQGRLPPGFTIPTDASGLIKLSVTATSCANGTSSELWVTIPVTPPSRWAKGTTPSSFALEAYADSPALLAWYGAVGPTPVIACVCTASAAGGPVLLDAFTAQAPGNAYSLQTALTPDTGIFPGGSSQVFLAHESTVFRLTVDAKDSVNRGFGSGELTYQGSGGAPPALPAELIHDVQGLAYTQRIELLGAA